MSQATVTPPVTSNVPPSPLEPRVREIGTELWSRIKGEVPGVFNKGYWEGRVMESVLADADFKVDLFRFVDVLPSLTTTEAVQRHMKEYLMKPGRDLGTFMGTAIKIATGGWGGFGAGLAVAAVRKNVTGMAERFIIGQNAAQALPELKKLYKQGFAFTVDLLGEATISDPEADAYQARYLDLIDNLHAEVSRWPADDLIDRNHLGQIPRTNISVKVSAMEPLLDAVDPAGSVDRLMKRILPLFLRAKEKGVFLNLDLEQWSMHGITYDLFERIVTDPRLKDWPHVGIVVQGYLKDSMSEAKRLVDIAKKRGTPLTVRLVKGAYWDYETVVARQNGYPCPVFSEKAATDENFERLTAYMLENIQYVQPAIASHNLRSIANAMARAEKLGLPRNAYEIQMLYGMAEPERAALRQMGNRVRLYAPVGELLPGMAYLVRRLLENTSNSGFLKISHHDKVDIGTLMAAPKATQPTGTAQTATQKFDNCPLTDFTDRALQAGMSAAVEQLGARLPVTVPVVIGGKKREGGNTLSRECPSHSAKVVAKVTMAMREEAIAAGRTAKLAAESWRSTPLAQRAALLHKLADRLEADRFELAAMQVWEVAKPLREADGDVAEAVDFCRYYAHQAMTELAQRKQGDVPGEDNQMIYEGRGVCLVIAPWNFPLAILTGMAVAALVAGCPVVLKPAEQSSAVAYQLYERMLAVGFDPAVVQFVPGDGLEVGATLVDSPDVAMIAFTGSKNVGLQIIQRAAVVHDGQEQVKRVVCEMGGKNAIIVDDDADLDEAVLGVLKSAFGYAGQKCSACSRVIAVGSGYDAFVKRLTEACHSIQPLPAEQPACMLPPVVDREAFDRLQAVVANPGAGAKALYLGKTDRTDGHYIAPAVFEVTDPRHRLMRDEFFGPIVAVIKAADFESALTIANGVEFKLTGAVYSRSPENLEVARSKFRVGNLYLNRGSTGALVERQPFGGFGMSGIGTKAGGPGYLLNFVDPRIVTENTMRRGVTPELAD